MSGAVQHIIKRCMEIMDKYPNIKSWEELAHDDQETWRSNIIIKQASEMKGIIEWDEKLAGFDED
jgi:hypothetical protein